MPMIYSDLPIQIESTNLKQFSCSSWKIVWVCVVLLLDQISFIAVCAVASISLCYKVQWIMLNMCFNMRRQSAKCHISDAEYVEQFKFNEANRKNKLQKGARRNQLLNSNVQRYLYNKFGIEHSI